MSPSVWCEAVVGEGLKGTLCVRRTVATMVRLSETVVLHRWLVCTREDQGLGLGPQPVDKRMCHEAAKHHGYGPGAGAGVMEVRMT